MNSTAAFIIACAIIGHCLYLTKSQNDFGDVIQRFSKTTRLKYKCVHDINLIIPETIHAPNPQRAYCEIFESQQTSSNYISTEIDLHNVESIFLKCRHGHELYNIQNSPYLSALHSTPDLVITGCALDNWPATALDTFTDLQSLSIISQNNKPYAINPDLNIEAHSFDRTLHLVHLFLPSNNILYLPAGIFCPLVKLQFLVLSGNKFQNIMDLCFYDSYFYHRDINTNYCYFCPLFIRHLDISYNQFMMIPNHAFSLLISLNELKLNSNRIQFIGESAFSRLNQLQSVDLSNNVIVHLNSNLFFECFATLTFINFHNNAIGSIGTDIFHGMANLQDLDLSQNDIGNAWLTNETFKGLIRLRTLNLSSNKFSAIGSSIFEDLFSLQALGLGNNQLLTIQDGTFANLKNLHRLILDWNLITFIGNNAFNGLLGLNELNLQLNQISSIERYAFKGCNSVRVLHLGNNLLTTIPDALAELKLLSEITLSDNLITYIDKPIINGSKLTYLALDNNTICNITKSALSTLPNLVSLSLSKNRLSNLQDGLFSANPHLQFLRVQFNSIYKIDFSAINAMNLSFANVSYNRLTSIDYSDLPPTLQILDADNNRITNITNRNNVSANLQMLYLSNNKISRIGPDSLPDSIERIILNNNTIVKIDDKTLIKKQNLTLIDLSHNRLTELNLSSIQIGQYDQLKPRIYLGKNKFVCSCHMAWLKGINTVAQNLYPTIADPESITCRFLDKPLPLSLVNISADAFTCPYTNYCPTLCSCCEYACDCEMICPMSCSCFHNDAWSVNIIICSNSSTFTFEESFSMDVTVMMLDGVNIGRITPHTFMGRKKMRELYLNGSHIRSIDENAFNKGTQLEKLYLQDNQLQKLGGELSELIYLQELYLQNNEISTIEQNALEKLTLLRILDIRNNRLRTISFEVFNRKPYLKSLSLLDNPWSCECTFKYSMRRWMIDHKYRLNLEPYTCQYDNGTTEYNDIMEDDDYYAQGSPCVQAGSFHNTAIEDRSHFQLSAVLILAGILILVFILLIGLIGVAISRTPSFYSYVKLRTDCCCQPGRMFLNLFIGGSWGDCLSARVEHDLYIIHYSNRCNTIDDIHQDILKYRPYLKTHVCHRRLASGVASRITSRMAIRNSKCVIIFLSQDFKSYSDTTRKQIEERIYAMINMSQFHMKLIVVFLEGVLITDLESQVAAYVHDDCLCVNVEKIAPNTYDRTRFFIELINKIDRLTNYDIVTGGVYTITNHHRGNRTVKNKKRWKSSNASTERNGTELTTRSNRFKRAWPRPSTSNGSSKRNFKGKCGLNLRNMSNLFANSTTNGVAAGTKNKCVTTVPTINVSLVEETKHLKDTTANNGEISTASCQLRSHSNSSTSSCNLVKSTKLNPKCSLHHLLELDIDLIPTPREEYVYNELINKPRHLDLEIRRHTAPAIQQGTKSKPKLPPLFVFPKHRPEVPEIPDISHMFRKRCPTPPSEAEEEESKL